MISNLALTIYYTMDNIICLRLDRKRVMQKLMVAKDSLVTETDSNNRSKYS